MLGHGGFSWDVTRHMVVVDDYVWETYVKAHPNTQSYKTKEVKEAEKSEIAISSCKQSQTARPQTLIGLSFGARVIFNCLENLAKRLKLGQDLKEHGVLHGLQDKAFKELAAAVPLSISARVESLDGNRNPASAKFCSELHIPGLNVPLNFALITSMQVVSSSSVNWFHSMHRTSSSISACTARTS
nr:Myb/SANT-like domain-containing protein [Tanacetum cinerariifolium]